MLNRWHTGLQEWCAWEVLTPQGDSDTIGCSKSEAALRQIFQPRFYGVVAGNTQGWR